MSENMSKPFVNELANRIGRDRKATELLLQGLSRALLRHCGELDTVAIPAFGNFFVEKHDEQIVTDHSTGNKILLPPEIDLVFRPAGKLRKLAENHSDDK